MDKIRELKNLIINGLVNKILPSKQHKRVLKWRNIDVDNTLLYNFELDDESIVFDVGGYKGEWSEKIFCKYNCRIYIFEPIKKFSNNISNLF